MPRTCTICRNPKRQEIDLALVRSESLREITNNFALSKSALDRHRQKCLPQHLLQAQDVIETQSADSLIQELLELAASTRLVLSRAMLEKDGELALKAIARLERQLELKGRILGEFEERIPTVQHVTVTYAEKAVFVQPGITSQPVSLQLPAPDDAPL